MCTEKRKDISGRVNCKGIGSVAQCCSGFFWGGACELFAAQHKRLTKRLND